MLPSGLMLYKDRKDYEFYPEIVEVTQPSSFFGHVNYKIKVTATPNNAFDSEPKYFQFSSRFKELNALYSVLAPLHRQLFLKGTFPIFVEAKIFGSMSPDTISERKNAIIEFLKFVLANEVLCKSRAFQQYIEKSHVAQIEKTTSTGCQDEDAHVNAPESVPKTNLKDTSEE